MNNFNQSLSRGAVTGDAADIRYYFSSWMVSSHSSKMSLGGLFNIFRENSSEIFAMFLLMLYCREYTDKNPTCQISGFQLCKRDWANLAHCLSKRTLTNYVCKAHGIFQQTLTVVFQYRQVWQAHSLKRFHITFIKGTTISLCLVQGCSILKPVFPLNLTCVEFCLPYVMFK